MNNYRQTNVFLLFCLTAALVVMYFIIKPFLAPLVLAAVFAFLFQTIYQKLLRFTKQRAGLAAFMATVTAMILVVLPIAFLGALIFKESSQLYQALASEDRSGLIDMVKNAADRIRATLSVSELFQLNFSQYARQALEVLVQNLGALFSSFAKILLNSFVFLIAFYFFLKDGRKLKDYFVALSPLSDKDDELIVSRLESAVSATVRGNLVIGLIQGTLTGIGFALFGVHC